MGWSFEMPPRKGDVPPPSSKHVRRVSLGEDDTGVERWVSVRGGGSQVEGQFLQWVFGLGRGPFDDADAEQAAALEMNAYLATFIADRVVEHNLVDAGGDPLPTGLGLFWALGTIDAMALLNLIRTPPRVITDPKAATTSSGG